MDDNNWLVILLIALLIWALNHEKKYEGMTAKQWFYELDACEAKLDELTYDLY